MTFFVFGNSVYNKDSSTLKVLPYLKKEFSNIKFVLCDPTESWNRKEKNPIILDTILGISDVAFFESLDKFFMRGKNITCHDYDLLMDLSLQKKLKKIESVRMIGLPVDFNLKTHVPQLANIISKIKPN